MRPATIPKDLVWDGAQHISIGVSADQRAQGTLPIEAITDTVEAGALDGARRIHVRIVLEAGDLETLERTEHLWITFLGGKVVPFSIQAEGGP